MVARSLGRESETRSAALLRSDAEGNGAFGVEGNDRWVDAWVVSDPDPVDIARAARLLLLDTMVRPSIGVETVAEARRRLIRDSVVSALSWIDRLAGRARRRALGPDAGDEVDFSAVSRFAPSALEAFHRKWFRPERAAIAVHGPVDAGSFRDLAQALLGVGGWAEAVALPPSRFPSNDPVPAGLRDIVLPRADSLGGCAVSWRIPGAEAGKQAIAHAMLLDAVVGLGKGSRLFALRERDGIAYELRSRFEPGFRAGSWTLWAMGRRSGPEYRDALIACVRGIADGTAPITEEALARARGLLLGQRESESQGGWALVRRTAAWQVLGHGECDRELPALLAQTTSQQIVGAAARVLATHPAVARTL